MEGDTQKCTIQRKNMLQDNEQANLEIIGEKELRGQSKLDKVEERAHFGNQRNIWKLANFKSDWSVSILHLN